ncbi:MAG: glycosyltransferase family 61 protein, partial [Rhodobacteraceae bacterium]|nr:glycosyltransferase family 61 protein [Paracoccaceae bacterium]
GIADHHAFMRQHARKDAPEPDLDIYVSRCKTGPSKGNHILEMVIERGMEAAGYRIFYPEEHTLAEQIATYARARRLVGVDGSAFHVAATALAPTARVALIARRAYYAGALARQVTAFSGAFATEIRAYSEVYAREAGVGKPGEWYKTLVLTDFEKLAEGLITHGFLDRHPGWRLPARPRIDSRLGRWGTRLGMKFVRVPDEILRTEPGAELDGG